MIEHLSYSSISLFLDCPEAWRRKYLAQEPTKTSPALVFGTAFHGALEAYLGAPQTEPVSYWAGAWAKALERDGSSIDWGIDTPETHCNEGVRLLSNEGVVRAVKNLTVRQDSDGPMIERKVTLSVPGVAVPVIGYIDFVAQDGVPCDLKTSSRAWSSDKASDSLQSLFYLAALNQAGHDWHQWRFRHVVFTKAKTPQVQVLEHSHKPAELFFLFRVVQSVWAAIQSGVFLVNPTGWRCGPQYCDFWAGCRGRYA